MFNYCKLQKQILLCLPFFFINTYNNDEHEKMYATY